MNIFKRLSKYLNKNAESFEILNINTNYLKEMYASKILEREGLISEYPTIVSLKNYEINALYLLILVDELSYKKICSLMKDQCDIDLSALGSDSKTQKKIDHEHIYFYKVENEFNGYLFGLITDDIELMNIISALELHTVAPWNATNLLPKDLVYLQGKEEYYWNTFWIRFYQSLNEKELEHYLSEANSPQLWKDYLRTFDNDHR